MTGNSVAEQITGNGEVPERSDAGNTGNMMSKAAEGREKITLAAKTRE